MAGLLLSLGLLPLGDLMETNIKLVRNGPFFAGVMCTCESTEWVLWHSSEL